MTLNRQAVVVDVAHSADIWDPTTPAFIATVVTDAYLEGARLFWERRARQLEAARPRPDDYAGDATPAELADRSRRLTEAARACRARAGLVDQDLADLRADLPGVLADLDHPTTGAA